MNVRKEKGRANTRLFFAQKEVYWQSQSVLAHKPCEKNANVRFSLVARTLGNSRFLTRLCEKKDEFSALLLGIF